MNPHLFRHAIAKIAVEADPGAYLAVSRVLGHTTLDTTMGHYLGTETKAAGPPCRPAAGRGEGQSRRRGSADGPTRRPDAPRPAARRMAAGGPGRLGDGAGRRRHLRRGRTRPPIGRRATRRTNVQHYGRWLGYLLWTGELDRGRRSGRSGHPRDGSAPTTATSRRLVAPRTRLSMLVGLKVMMQAMAPDRNWRWLQDACNRVQITAKPQHGQAARGCARRPRSLRPRSRNWSACPLARLSLKQALAYRDALMLALLAARPLRVKNFTALELGRHLIRHGGQLAASPFRRPRPRPVSRSPSSCPSRCCPGSSATCPRCGRCFRTRPNRPGCGSARRASCATPNAGLSPDHQADPSACSGRRSTRTCCATAPPRASPPSRPTWRAPPRRCSGTGTSPPPSATTSRPTTSRRAGASASILDQLKSRLGRTSHEARRHLRPLFEREPARRLDRGSDRGLPPLCRAARASGHRRPSRIGRSRAPAATGPATQTCWREARRGAFDVVIVEAARPPGAQALGCREPARRAAVPRHEPARGQCRRDHHHACRHARHDGADVPVRPAREDQARAARPRAAGPRRGRQGLRL